MTRQKHFFSVLALLLATIAPVAAQQKNAHAPTPSEFLGV